MFLLFGLSRRKCEILVYRLLSFPCFPYLLMIDSNQNLFINVPHISKDMGKIPDMPE